MVGDDVRLPEPVGRDLAERHSHGPSGEPAPLVAKLRNQALDLGVVHAHVRQRLDQPALRPYERGDAEPAEDAVGAANVADVLSAPSPLEADLLEPREQHAFGLLQD